MRWSASRDEVADALRTVSKVARFTGGGPSICAGVHMDARGETVEMTCTDLSETWTVDVAAKVDTDGVEIVSARTLTDFVAGGSAADVQVESKDGSVVVGVGRARGTFATYDESSWPRRVVCEDPVASLDKATLAGIRSVLHAASQDHARPLLTGVHFGSGLVVCTDSHRLAAQEVDYDGPEITVPAPMVNAALRYDSSSAELAADNMRLTWRTGPLTLTSQLVMGAYPEWKRMLRSDSPHVLTVDGEALAAAVKRVAVLDSGDGRLVSLHQDGGELAVEARDGSATTTLDVVECSGSAPGLHFNAAYLVDMLNTHPPGEVHLEAVDELKSVQAKTGGLTTLLMPIRVTK